LSLIDVEALRSELNASSRIIFEKRLLLNDLPPELTRQDEHLQIRDNYILETNLRLRKIRIPATNDRFKVLTRKAAIDNKLYKQEVTNILLSEADFGALSRFEGNEIGKNRYPYIYEGSTYFIDLFMGPLLGLVMARIYFSSEEEINRFKLPEFALLDVTSNPKLIGPALLKSSFQELKAELRELIGKR
jgi:CYTH domain-containing protein